MRKYFLTFAEVFGLVVLLVGLSGCAFFSNIFQGSFDANNWEIQKVVIDGKEYLGVNELRKKAILDLEKAKSAELSSDENESDTQRIDNVLDTNDKKPTIEDLQELAQNTENSTLSFDVTQNKIYGVGTCNQFSANYTWKDADRISVYEVSFTRKLCSPHELMDFEINLSKKFEGIYFVQKIDKNSMILKGKGVEIYLKRYENSDSKN